MVRTKSRRKSLGRKKLASQFAWVSIGRLLGALIQAVTMLLLARDLGPYEFGIFSAVFGTAIVFQSGLDLGIATMVVKERAADSANPIIQSALKLADRLAFAIFGVTALPLLAMGLFLDSFFYALLPLSVWAACERHTDTWLSVPLADGDARINTQNLLIKRTVTALLYVGAVLADIDPAVAFSAAMALTALVSLVVIRKVVYNRIDVARPLTPYSAVLRQSWPYWLNSLGTQARNLDTLLVSAVAGPSQAGLYAVTSRATGPLRILSTSMAAVLLPASASKSPKQIRRLLRFVGLATIGCAILYGGLVLIAPAVIRIFLGDSYIGATLPLQIVLGGLVFAAISSLFTSMLQGVGLQLYVAKTAIITTSTCLVLVCAGGLYQGAIGAALALAGSFVIQAMILATKIIRYSRRRPTHRRHSMMTRM